MVNDQIQRGSMGKNVVLWVFIALVMLYLVFRAVTPFWVDMLFIVTGAAVLLYEAIKKGRQSGASEDAGPDPSEKK